MKRDTNLAWHFVETDGHLTHDLRHIKAEVGLTVTVDCIPTLCEVGLHASNLLTDALQYAPSDILCLVKLGGNVYHGLDKSVATKRTILAMLDAHDLFVQLAVDITRDALKDKDIPHIELYNQLIDLYAQYVAAKNKDKLHKRFKNLKTKVVEIYYGPKISAEDTRIALLMARVTNCFGADALSNALQMYFLLAPGEGRHWYETIEPLNDMIEAKVLEAMQYELPRPTYEGKGE